MAEVNVTPVLRDTIKNYRKELKIRGDELSRNLKKNTSFISQLETGKIETISTNLLYKIFDELFSNDENKNKKINDILKQMKLTLSDKELERQKWLTVMDLQYRLLPIEESIIEYIESSLKELNINASELTSIINKNDDLKSSFTQEQIDDMEDNKVYPIFKDNDESSYIIGMNIKFNLTETFIDDIIAKKIKRSNFITIHGIIYNILMLKGLNEKDAIQQSEKFLFDNKFYTLMHKQHLTKDSDELADYDRDFNNKLKQLNAMLETLNDNQPNLLNGILKVLNKNIYDNPALILSVLKRDLTVLQNIPKSEQKLFMKDFDKLIQEYTTHTEDLDKDKIETF